MEIIGIVLLVAFVIICLLIICLVLVQDENGDSLGGLFAGGSNSAFGSRSASVLTKATYVIVGLFFVSAFFLAFINKTPGDKGLEEAARAAQSDAKATEWWNTQAAAPAATAPATDAAAPATDATAPASTTAPAAPAKQ